MVLRMKNLIFWGFTKSQYRRGDCLKREGLAHFADLRVELGKKGVVFLRGGAVDTPMHTMINP